MEEKSVALKCSKFSVVQLANSLRFAPGRQAESYAGSGVISSRATLMSHTIQYCGKGLTTIIFHG